MRAGLAEVRALRRPGCAATLTGVLALVLLGPGAAESQRVRGRVEDASGAAVAGAELRFRTSAGVLLPLVLSDSAGRFVIVLPGPDVYAVSGVRLGFRAMGPALVEAGAGEEIEVVVRMDPAPVPLEPLVVRARHRVPTGTEAVYQRIERMRQQGIGVAATRENLDRMSRHSVGSVLSTLSTRLRIIDTQQMTVNTILLRDGSQRGGYCPMAVFIDGLRANPRPTNVNLLIEPRAIEAVELYMGAAQVPLGFQDPLGCGSVLIWSRQGSAADGKPHSLRRYLLAGGLLVGALLLFR